MERRCVSLACNLSALSRAERDRRRELSDVLAAAVVHRSETPSGYTFSFRLDDISLADTAAWIGLERKCCPFFRFHLETDGEHPVFTLTLDGGEGVKTLVEFDLRELFDANPGTPR